MIAPTSKEAKFVVAALGIAARVYLKRTLPREDENVQAYADAMGRLAPGAGIANLGRKLGRNVPFGRSCLRPAMARWSAPQYRSQLSMPEPMVPRAAGTSPCGWLCGYLRPQQDIRVTGSTPNPSP